MQLGGRDLFARNSRSSSRRPWDPEPFEDQLSDLWDSYYDDPEGYQRNVDDYSDRYVRSSRRSSSDQWVSEAVKDAVSGRIKQDQFMQVLDEMSGGSSPKRAVREAIKQFGWDKRDLQDFGDLMGELETEERDSWGAFGFLNSLDFDYDDIEREIERGIKDINRQQTERDMDEGRSPDLLSDDKKSQLRDDDEKNYEDMAKQYDELYSELEDIEKEYSDRKPELIEKYGLAEDMMDNMIEQEREYSASPSVVDAQLEKSLAEQTQAEIEKRLASRSRYGQLEGKPGAMQGRDRLAMAKDRVAAKLQEKQMRHDSLQRTVGAGAQFKSGIADRLADLEQNYLGGKTGILSSKLGLSTGKHALQKGRPYDLINLVNLMRGEKINQEAYLNRLNMLDTEGLEANRRARDADVRGQWGTAKVIGGGLLGLGGAFMGPAGSGLVGAGGKIADQGLDQMSSARIDSDRAGKPTFGLYSGSRYELPYSYHPIGRYQSPNQNKQGVFGGLSDWYQKWREERKDQKTLSSGG